MSPRDDRIVLRITTTMTVQAIFDQLLGSRDDVLGAVVVADSGQATTTRGVNGMAAAATALVAPLRDMLERATAELGGGRFQCTLVESDTSKLALADIDGLRTVVLVGSADVAPGLLRHDALSFAEALRLGGV